MFLFCHDTTVSALGLLCKYFSVGTRVCERLLERRFDCQGDREGRPYNTKSPVLHVNVYCTGDPRGRPGGFLAIIHIRLLNVGKMIQYSERKNSCRKNSSRVFYFPASSCASC